MDLNVRHRSSLAYLGLFIILAIWGFSFYNYIIVGQDKLQFQSAQDQSMDIDTKQIYRKKRDVSESDNYNLTSSMTDEVETATNRNAVTSNRSETIDENNISKNQSSVHKDNYINDTGDSTNDDTRTTHNDGDKNEINENRSRDNDKNHDTSINYPVMDSTEASEMTSSQSSKSSNSFTSSGLLDTSINQPIMGSTEYSKMTSSQTFNGFTTSNLPDASKNAPVMSSTKASGMTSSQTSNGFTTSNLPYTSKNAPVISSSEASRITSTQTSNGFTTSNLPDASKNAPVMSSTEASGMTSSQTSNGFTTSNLSYTSKNAPVISSTEASRITSTQTSKSSNNFTSSNLIDTSINQSAMGSTEYSRMTSSQTSNDFITSNLLDASKNAPGMSSTEASGMTLTQFSKSTDSFTASNLHDTIQNKPAMDSTEASGMTSSQTLNGFTTSNLLDTSKKSPVMSSTMSRTEANGITSTQTPKSSNSFTSSDLLDTSIKQPVMGSTEYSKMTSSQTSNGFTTSNLPDASKNAPIMSSTEASRLTSSQFSKSTDSFTASNLHDTIQNKPAMDSTEASGMTSSQTLNGFTTTNLLDTSKKSPVMSSTMSSTEANGITSTQTSKSSNSFTSSNLIDTSINQQVMGSTEYSRMTSFQTSNGFTTSNLPDASKNVPVISSTEASGMTSSQFSKSTDGFTASNLHDTSQNKPAMDSTEASGMTSSQSLNSFITSNLLDTSKNAPAMSSTEASRMTSIQFSKSTDSFTASNLHDTSQNDPDMDSTEASEMTSSQTLNRFTTSNLLDTSKKVPVMSSTEASGITSTPTSKSSNSFTSSNLINTSINQLVMGSTEYSRMTSSQTSNGFTTSNLPDTSKNAPVISSTEASRITSTQTPKSSNSFTSSDLLDTSIKQPVMGSTEYSKMTSSQTSNGFTTSNLPYASKNAPVMSSTEASGMTSSQFSKSTDSFTASNLYDTSLYQPAMGSTEASTMTSSQTSNGFKTSYLPNTSKNVPVISSTEVNGITSSQTSNGFTTSNLPDTSKNVPIISSTEASRITSTQTPKSSNSFTSSDLLDTSIKQPVMGSTEYSKMTSSQTSNGFTTSNLPDVSKNAPVMSSAEASRMTSSQFSKSTDSFTASNLYDTSLYQPAMGSTEASTMTSSQSLNSFSTSNLLDTSKNAAAMSSTEASGTTSSQTSNGFKTSNLPNTSKNAPVISSTEVNGITSTQASKTLNSFTTSNLPDASKNAPVMSSTEASGKTSSQGSENVENSFTTFMPLSTAAADNTSIFSMSYTFQTTTLKYVSMMDDVNITSTVKPPKIDWIKCAMTETFCLQERKCVMKEKKDIDHYSLISCLGDPVCGRRIKCQQLLESRQLLESQQFCSHDQVYCLKTQRCIACPPRNDYAKEFPNLFTTESSIDVPPPGSRAQICPYDRIILPILVPIYCLSDSDCPLQSNCCHRPTEKNSCVWLIDKDSKMCPKFLFYCNITKSCQLPMKPCMDKCLPNWEFCPSLKQCAKAGMCQNISDNKTKFTPFDFSNNLFPELIVNQPNPYFEDQPILLKLANIFQFKGTIDQEMELKEKFLLKYFNEYMKWELSSLEYSAWENSFSAFLSAKLPVVLITSALTKRNDMPNEVSQIFPCYDSDVLLEVVNGSHYQSPYCNGGAPLQVKMRNILSIRSKPDFNGDILITVQPQVLDVFGNRFTGNIQQLNVTVLPVDDAPVIKWRAAQLDFEISRLTEVDEGDLFQGVLVDSIVSAYFEDPDGDQLGMAVLAAQKSSLGVWQYSLEGNDKWTDISDIDPECEIFRVLKIDSNHQGVVDVDGIVVERIRRSIKFSDKTTYNDNIYNETDYSFKTFSQEFQYSNDYKLISQTKSSRSYMLHAAEFHDVSDISNLRLDLSWRDRKPDFSSILPCSGREMYLFDDNPRILESFKMSFDDSVEHPIFFDEHRELSSNLNIDFNNLLYKFTSSPESRKTTPFLDATGHGNKNIDSSQSITVNNFGSNQETTLKNVDSNQETTLKNVDSNQGTTFKNVYFSQGTTLKYADSGHSGASTSTKNIDSDQPSPASTSKPANNPDKITVRPTTDIASNTRTYATNTPYLGTKDDNGPNNNETGRNNPSEGRNGNPSNGLPGNTNNTKSERSSESDQNGFPGRKNTRAEVQSTSNEDSKNSGGTSSTPSHYESNTKWSSTTKKHNMSTDKSNTNIVVTKQSFTAYLSTRQITTPSPTTTTITTVKPIYIEKEESFHESISLREKVVLFLPPTAKLRFFPYNFSNSNGSIMWWSIIDACAYSKLAFLAWDPRNSSSRGACKNTVDFQLCSKQNKTCTSFNESHSAQLVVIHQRVVGHSSEDNSLFTKPKGRDACGICGGTNSTCRDCRGIINGGSVTVCGECVSNTDKCFNKYSFGHINTPMRPCNLESIDSCIDKCGNCQPNKTAKTALLCNRCPQVYDRRISSNQFRMFYCNDTWQKNRMSDVIAIGPNPHLRWHRISDRQPTVYIDLASFVGSTLLLHVYGPSWSYKSDIFSKAGCNLINAVGKVVQNLTAIIKKDRLQVELTGLTMTTDHRVECQLATPAGNYYSLSPFAKLSIVDSRLIKIKNVSPSHIDASKNYTIKIRGSEFYNTSDLTCIYMRHPSRQAYVLSSAKYIDGSKVNCNVDSSIFKESMTIEIGVIYSLDAVHHYHIRHSYKLSTATVDVYGEEPKLQKLVISNDFKSVVATFSCNIVVLDDCSYIFSDMKGFANVKCNCKANTVTIYSISSIDLVENSYRTISSRNKIKCAYGDLHPVASGQSRIESHTQNSIEFDVIGPKQMCKGSATYEVTSIKGTTLQKAEITYILGLTENSSGINMLENRHNVSKATKNVGSIANGYQVNFQQLIPHSWYNLEITVANTWTAVSKMLSLIYVPSTVSDNVVVNIYGHSMIDPLQDAYLEAKVTFCPGYNSLSSTPRLSFYWEIDGSCINLERNRERILKLDKGRLEGGRNYTIRCLVIANGENQITSTAEFFLNTSINNPIVSIPVSEMSVVIGQSFSLNGLRSSDPYRPSQNLMFLWTCSVPNGDDCVTIVNNINVHTRLYRNGPVLNVDDDLLSVGRYLFKLSVFTADGRNNSETVLVTVIAGTNQTPSINVVQGNRHVISGNAVGLRAFLDASAGTQMIWKVIHQTGFSSFDLFTGGAACWAGVISDQNQMQAAFSTSIPAAALQPDSQYKLMMVASHPLEGKAYAVVLLQTNPIPSLEIISVYPFLGKAILDTFTICISDAWTRDKGTLVRIGYRKYNTIRYLRRLIGPSHCLTDLRLPAVYLPNGYLTIVVEACDSDKVCAVFEHKLKVKVMIPSLDSDQDMELFRNTVDEYIAQGDTEAAIAHVISCRETLEIAGVSRPATMSHLLRVQDDLIRHRSLVAFSDSTQLSNGLSILRDSCDVLSDMFQPTANTLTAISELSDMLINTYVRPSYSVVLSSESVQLSAESVELSSKSDYSATILSSNEHHKKPNVVHSGTRNISLTHTETVKHKFASNHYNSTQTTPSSNRKIITPRSKRKITTPSSNRKMATANSNRKITTPKRKRKITIHSGNRKTGPRNRNQKKGRKRRDLSNRMRDNPFINTAEAETLLCASDLLTQKDSSYIPSVNFHLVQNLPYIWTSIFNGLITNGEPSVVSMKEVTIQTTKFDFDRLVIDQETNIVLQNTPSAYILSQTELRLVLEDNAIRLRPHCDSRSSNCGTVCLGMADFIRDPLSRSLSKTTQLRSHVIMLKAILHGSDEEFDLLESTIVKIGLTVVLSNVLMERELNYLKCGVWFDETLTWNTRVCNTTDIMIDDYAVHVKCTCPPFSSFGVHVDEIQAPLQLTRIPPFTYSSTTVIWPFTKSTVASDGKATAKPDIWQQNRKYFIIYFKILGDFNRITCHNVLLFIEVMRRELVWIFKVPESVFPDFQVEPGSAQVTMTVVPDPCCGDGKAILNAMTKMISDGNFCFNNPNNEVVCADPDSYKLIHSDFQASHGGSSIVGTIIGVTVAIVIFIVGLCIIRTICKRKRKLRKNVVGVDPATLIPTYKAFGHAPVQPVGDISFLEGTIDSRPKYHMSRTKDTPSNGSDFSMKVTHGSPTPSHEPQLPNQLIDEPAVNLNGNAQLQPQTFAENSPRQIHKEVNTQ